MANPGFGHLWQQAEMSDVNVVVSVAEDEDIEELESGDENEDETKPQSSDHRVLQQFPGHSLILSYSPYFRAQAMRWSTQPQAQAQAQGSSQSVDPASTTQQPKNQSTITLPNASYEPAAMAVLAGLYFVKPWPELLADLTPQQQVHAAVLADMWELPVGIDAAVAVLKAPTDNKDRLSAVLEGLLSLEAVPDFLLPAFEQPVLSKYGNLEAVWGPEGALLRKSIMVLPLPAMVMLLASDKLKVASEDTVLFTAQQYADGFFPGSTQQEAVDKLAPLVRCPRLSQFWLAASVLSDDANKRLLWGLQPQLKRLLLRKQAYTAGMSAQEL